MNTLIAGTSGNDSFTALPGNERIDGNGGIDTITFNFRLVDATVTFQGNQVIIDGPSGSHTVLSGLRGVQVHRRHGEQQRRQPAGRRPVSTIRRITTCGTRMPMPTRTTTPSAGTRAAIRIAFF